MSTSKVELTAKQAALSKWIEKYNNDFFAHAVWRDNVSEVFASGKVMSAEHVLRVKGKVSYEAGFNYGSRRKAEITPKLLQTVKSKRLPQLIELKESGYINKNNFIDYEREFNEYEAILKEIKLESGEENNFIVQIAADMVSDNPLDKRLACIWQQQYKPGDYDHNNKLARTLYPIRCTEIGTSKLSCDIRGMYCSVAWGYGDVVVLRGNAKNIIIYNYRYTLEKGMEVQIMEAYQNNGEFFTLDLDDKDTIILGPAAILNKHQQQLNKCQTFSYEELSTEQLDFFKVPDDLRKPKPSVQNQTKISPTEKNAIDSHELQEKVEKKSVNKNANNNETDLKPEKILADLQKIIFTTDWPVFGSFKLGFFGSFKLGGVNLTLFGDKNHRELKNTTTQTMYQMMEIMENKTQSYKSKNQPINYDAILEKVYQEGNVRSKRNGKKPSHKEKVIDDFYQLFAAKNFEEFKHDIAIKLQDFKQNPNKHCMI